VFFGSGWGDVVVLLCPCCFGGEEGRGEERGRVVGGGGGGGPCGGRGVLGGGGGGVGGGGGGGVGFDSTIKGQDLGFLKLCRKRKEIKQQEKIEIRRESKLRSRVLVGFLKRPCYKLVQEPKRNRIGEGGRRHVSR